MGDVKSIKQNRLWNIIDELCMNKGNIKQLVVCFEDQDSIIRSATACASYVEAKGMVAILDENLTYQAQNDEFEPFKEE